MTQEDKELLLKDIYARIPYGVKGCCESETFRTTPLHWYAEFTLEYSVNYMVIKSEWRPYLFPLSRLNELDIPDFRDTFTEEVIDINENTIRFFTLKTYDWLNAHHYDYRGLIEKGLAIDATGKGLY